MNYYRISDLTRTIDARTDKYLVQTRSQTKSSGIKVPKVHGASKGLISHVKPELQKLVVTPIVHLTPPTHNLRPIHQAPSIDQRLPTNAVHPYPNLELDKAELELGGSQR